jgi:cephalosporin hydroxylase
MKRDFNSGLSTDVLNNIQKGTLSYSYKDIVCQKNPFDLSLYTKLLWSLKPKTIIEIGSAYGGSALWFADTLSSFNLNSHIYSIDLDISKIDIVDDRITFIQGSLFNLDSLLPERFIRNLSRPLLIIEDSSHFYHATYHVLNFFKSLLEKGEYIIIEDGIVRNLGENYKQYNDGPNKAIEQFIERNKDFVIDTNYCDFFGHNYTWNTNGFLKKIV